MVNETDLPSIIYLDSYFGDNKRCRNIFKKYIYYEYAFKHKFYKNEEEDKLVELIKSTHLYLREYVPIVK